MSYSFLDRDPLDIVLELIEQTQKGVLRWSRASASLPQELESEYRRLMEAWLQREGYSRRGPGEPLGVLYGAARLDGFAVFYQGWKLWLYLDPVYGRHQETMIPRTAWPPPFRRIARLDIDDEEDRSYGSLPPSAALDDLWRSVVRQHQREQRTAP